MLLLTKEDIRKVFTMKDAVEADKECYRAFSEGRFDVPLRAVIHGSKGNFLFMPAYCEDMKAADMAALLNRNESTVRTQLQKGRELLRKMLCETETYDDEE